MVGVFDRWRQLAVVNQDGSTISGSSAVEDIAEDAVELIEEYPAGVEAKPSDILLCRFLGI